MQILEKKGPSFPRDAQRSDNFAWVDEKDGGHGALNANTNTGSHHVISVQLSGGMTLKQLFCVIVTVTVCRCSSDSQPVYKHG